ncbi:MAG: NADH-quinone oxidoreductase subunit J [Pirellulales bacterium]|nr:NADH-quinone oxidoreductase subunit J [Pirellulales bacterium]
MQWIEEHWQAIALVLLGGGIWWLLPRSVSRRRIGPLAASLVGGYMLARLFPADSPVGESFLFFTFAGAALLCAILMITNRNPVYAALWFALATLCVCGLFWLQFAPFLAAATVIVYAGAIVVTFVFVIMLAQQSGATAYDQRSRQPLLATIGAMLLLSLLINMMLASSPDDLQVAAQRPTATAAAGALSVPPDQQSIAHAPMRGLGRSLFGDYLFAVELAGTLLLVATIGAIAIAPRRSRGTL